MGPQLQATPAQSRASNRILALLQLLSEKINL